MLNSTPTPTVGYTFLAVSLKHDGPTGQTTGQRGSGPSALMPTGQTRGNDSLIFACAVIRSFDLTVMVSVLMLYFYMTV